MSNVINVLTADGASSVLEILTSPLLIIIYIAVVILLILLVVISVMINERRFNQSVKRILSQAKKTEKLDQLEREEKAGKNKNRFELLKKIDAEGVNKRSDFTQSCTLHEICDEFRLFAANRLNLYYDISDIRQFVAGLAVSRILILQGMSGTGKTSLAYAFGEFIDNSSVVIPVQPMWKERTDLLGYYNEFTRRFNETLLLEKMYEAGEREDMYITIMDELNIARVEYYFAEFLSLLEIPNPAARYLEVGSDHWETDPAKLKNGRIRLPENMWFVGTANNDDSTFSISDKVYDRAMVLNLDRKSEPFQTSSSKKMPLTAKKFDELARKAVEDYSVTQESLARLDQLDKYLIEKFQITFGNRIMRQILRYIPIFIACGGTEPEALDDILTKKVLRKLETQNTAYLRSESEELCNYIEGLFGENAMPRCTEYIRRIARNI